MKQKSNKATLASMISLVVIFGLIVVNFQNCSSMTSSDFNAVDDAISQGDKGTIIAPNPDAPIIPLVETGLKADFQQGDQYTGQTLVSESSFIDQLITKFNYQTHQNGKAIAVAESGLGFVVLTNNNDFDEADALALESCNLITGDSCAVIVSGNTFTMNDDEISANAQYVLDGYKGEAFDKNKMPLINQRVRDGNTISSYESAVDNKALAVSIEGGVYATYTYSYKLSESEAKRMALQQCEMEASLHPCLIYAVNDEVVFDPMSWVKKSNISFTNNNVLGSPPPGAIDVVVSQISDFIKEVGNVQKYALYITPRGGGYFGEGTTKELAKTQAREKCEAVVDEDDCIEYATSAGVTLTPTSLKSKKNFPDLFCSVPRYSCSDHSLVGCTNGGSYWIQDSRTLKSVLSSCGSI